MDEFIGHGIESFSTFRNDTEISTSVKITNAPPEPAATVDPVPPTPVEQEPADPVTDEKLDQDIKDDATDIKNDVDAVESLCSIANNHIILQKHIKKSGRLESDVYAFVDTTMQFRAQAGKFGYNTPSLEAFSPNSAMHRRAVMEASQGTVANIKQRIVEFIKNLIAKIKNIGAKFMAKLAAASTNVDKHIAAIKSLDVRSVNYDVIETDGADVLKSDVLQRCLELTIKYMSDNTVHELEQAFSNNADSLSNYYSELQTQLQAVFQGYDNIKNESNYRNGEFVLKIATAVSEIVKRKDNFDKLAQFASAELTKTVNSVTGAGDDATVLEAAKTTAHNLVMIVELLRTIIAITTSQSLRVTSLYIKAAIATKKTTADQTQSQEATATAV